MSTSSDNLQSVLEDAGKDGTFIKIVVGLLIVFLTAVVLFLWKKKRIIRRGVCLVGLCDSGKTLVFSQLIYKKPVESYTSLKENVATLLVENKASLELVDVPGHERVRQRYFQEYKISARAIVFVVDSLNIVREIRDVAEYLYTILSDTTVQSNRPRVLILCNKQDHALAKGSHVIKSLIEKEMNILRTTRSNQLEATSESGTTSTFLGSQEKDFEFVDLHPLKVSFSAASAQTGDLQELTNWLTSIA